MVQKIECDKCKSLMDFADYDKDFTVQTVGWWNGHATKHLCPKCQKILDLIIWKWIWSKGEFKTSASNRG